MEVIDFAREQLLYELSELEKYRKSKDFNDDRYKLKLAGILSNYEIKKEIKETFETDIQEKMAVYLAAKKIEGLSQITLTGYRYELNMLNQVINKNTIDITSNDLRYYLSTFDQLALSSIASKVWKLKSFFGWLHREEIINRDPSAKLRAPTVDNMLVKTLTVEEFEMMREACETLRERTLIECLYTTGCRLSEMANMNISDVNMFSKKAKVFGKGRKERIVFFNVKALYYFKKYMKSRNDDCEALFVTYRKPYRRVSGRSIQDEVDTIATRAKISHPVTPHWFRRTMATRMLETGASIATVQDILGHASPETTRRYLNITEEFKQEQHKKYLPM